MSIEWLAKVEVEEIKRQAELSSSKRVKREWIKRGYSHQISFYGVLTDAETEESQYCRIEVLAENLYTFEEVFLIYHFFMTLKPMDSYTIWIYSRANEGIRYVGRYEKRG